ncbi:asparagine synthase, glutamine-hydrolyzing [Owenweeksia hongkongensis DSM 17368]|uniref:asparagine synthase (glutamine-hydrolyzing) n=1 Tax=Owenweeksia hongkongensis (strain DSM 17368 / CIP 108786 / JCM 12287 / NRRL B-23963 / UST20020801) TaxID=926562 RepID=G8R4U6_OWEHD|nr:asparagine synthase (glutamine-hydrolyzing) [Owenweeksia hongkongensis]AEV34260.1 asparagine synthase, glutamine-hydrolyzing [Owenweeksia hongkongensis DSM 17368]
MCGIYMTNLPVTEENVRGRMKEIDFRGPDNLGYQKVNSITMSHLRLSILDLESRSNQPFRYEHLHIVFNGEIYNFLDIKEELIAKGYTFDTTSDTEVLIKGYDAWGKDLLPRLNGMFAFSIYDESKNEIFSARDRLGVKPFFYYWNKGNFEICSQLRPLIKADSKISEEAVSIYLDCGYVPSPLSIIENVYKLRPGNFMIINLNTGEKSIKEYWGLEPVVERNVSYEDAREEIHQLLNDAVKIRLHADVSLGSFLSGGVDSALVTAIAAKNSPTKIKTFSIGFDDPRYDESQAAAEYAKILGTEHTEIMCSPKDALEMLPLLIKAYDEPFADSSALPSLLLNKVTKQHVTVALSGDGGDESFLGYNNFYALERFNRISRIPSALRKIAFGILSRLPGKASLKNKFKILGITDSDEFTLKRFIGYNSIQRKRKLTWVNKFYSEYKENSSNSLQRMADLNIKLWLENDSNTKVDRASMASSVEVRSPFLDYRIIEAARELPVSYRYGNGQRKKILKDILEDYIPKEVFTRPKKGFSIPLSKWIQQDLKQEFYEALTDSFFESIPNLNVKKARAYLEDHMSGKDDHSFNLWKLFVLSKWMKEFGFHNK